MNKAELIKENNMLRYENHLLLASLSAMQHTNKTYSDILIQMQQIPVDIWSAR